MTFLDASGKDDNYFNKLTVLTEDVNSAVGCVSWLIED